MTFYVYIIQSVKDNNLYIGSTQNLPRRLQQHNDPNRKTYTAKRGPWRLLYQEEHLTRRDAVRRERFLKSHAGSHEKKQLAGIKVEDRRDPG
jgi:putative endonuclease